MVSVTPFVENEARTKGRTTASRHTRLHGRKTKDAVVGEGAKRRRCCRPRQLQRSAAAAGPNKNWRPEGSERAPFARRNVRGRDAGSAK